MFTLIHPGCKSDFQENSNAVPHGESLLWEGLSMVWADPSMAKVLLKSGTRDGFYAELPNLLNES